MIINTINTYFVIIAYGALVLLSFLLISNPLRVNKKANLWFGLFLFLWSMFWIEEIFVLIKSDLLNYNLLTCIRFLRFLTPIFFYFSVVYYTNPDFKFKTSDFKYLIFPLIFLVGLMVQQDAVYANLIAISLNVLIIIQAIYFIVASYLKIKRYKIEIELFASNTSEINLNWIEYIIIALFVLSIFIGVYNILFVDADLNLFANIVSFVIIIFVAYNALKQKEIFIIKDNQITADDSDISKRKLISDQDLDALKTKLLHLMESQKPYLDPELNLVKLAEQINIPAHQLSYVINSGFNENFFMFVNRYRVEKVKELLLSEEKNHLSIMGIAFEAGFNSKTSFNTTFKKISSQTPSEFKKRSSTL